MLKTEEISNKIKEIREKLDLTQEDLGRMLGTSKQAICSWEKGRNMPDVISMFQILELEGDYVAKIFHPDVPLGRRADAPIALSPDEQKVIARFRRFTALHKQEFMSLFGCK